MEQKYLSFLYQSRESEEKDRTSAVRISQEVTDEIGLSTLFSLKNSSLSSFFTADAEVIAYRQSVFGDMARIPALSETLRAVLPILCDITELRRLEEIGRAHV